MFRPVQSISRWLQSNGFFHWASPVREKAAREETLGQAGERIAARYLKKHGYKIITRGHRQKLGEIDIIAVDRECVVFVEVKTWKTDRDEDPSAAVNRKKQERITRAALLYLKQNKLLDTASRFDVLSIVWDGSPSTEPRIRHFQHAFEATGRWQMFR